jgi:hypothetical protein
MQNLSPSVLPFTFAQAITNTPVLGAITFAVDQTVNLVIQKVWPDIQASAKQFAIPAKVIASYMIASSFHVQGSLLITYGLYATAKTITNCTHLVLAGKELDTRIFRVNIVALAGILASTAIYATTLAVGCPLSPTESTLAAGCAAHWIARSFPEELEEALITKITY